MNRGLKFENNTNTLDEIISCQRSPFIKIDLVYGMNKKNPKEISDFLDRKPQKKVMNENIKAMFMFSKYPSKMKET